VAGRDRKSRAMKVFGQLSQNELDGITVLRQKSCQPQKNNQLNQKLTDSTGLSSVHCRATGRNYGPKKAFAGAQSSHNDFP